MYHFSAILDGFPFRPSRPARWPSTCAGRRSALACCVVGVVIEWMLTGYELFGGGDVDVLRSALAPQDRKVLHHDISIYRPRFQFHVDLDELSPPESGFTLDSRTSVLLCIVLR